VTLKRNLIANCLGQGWAALMGLLFIPLYIKFLGIEAYGLIGLFALLQAWLALLDMGMTPTLTREMARFAGGARTAQSISDLLRSIEIVAVAIACLITLAVAIASDWLATEWLQAEGLPVSVVAHAFAIMGAVTAIRFIESVYRSSMIGLQHQVLLNSVNGAMATLRGAGAVAVLVWVSPTIQAFFIWQGIVSVINLTVFAWVTYRALPKSDRPARFSLPELLGIGRFAGGMVGIVFLSLLLMQVDKLLLTRLLTLSEYGYYTLAAVAAAALNTLSGPITQAWYPRLNQLHASGNTRSFIKTYHQGAQLLAVVMGSAAITLILFSDTLLLLWTQNLELAKQAAGLVSVLALGNLLNGLMRVPHMAQLTYGWTSLSNWINTFAIFAVIPAIFWATPRFGAVGAAWVWVALNAGYVLIGIQLMYRRILVHEKWRWYMEDVLQPLAGPLIVGLLLKWAVTPPATAIGQFCLLAAAAIITLASAAVTSTLIRRRMIDHAAQWLYPHKIKPA
jgi:O-antigen/teichoic acid export membrane protein